MATSYRTTTIFRRWGQRYIEEHRPGRHQCRIIRAISQCRTPALGGRMIECLACGNQHFIYQGCGNRNCPICPALKKEFWLFKRQQELLPGVTYFHLVFTVPHELNPLFLNHPREMFTLLFRAANQAFRKELSATYGPVQSGMLAMLHTWGQNLSYHPHVHAIVPGAGLSPDGARWVKPRSNKWLLDVKKLSARFRRSFLHRLTLWWDAGEEPRFRGSAAHWNDPAEWTRMIKKVRSKKWVVHAQAPAKGADQVLTYLSRYVHRVAFSEGRILEVTDEKVHFDYKDYRLKDPKDRPVHRQMWLDGEEFLRRFLMHTLQPRFQRIRYYGIWASAARKKLRRAQKLLAGPRSLQVVVWSVRHFLKHVLGIDPDVCPECGCVGQLVTWRLTPGGELLPMEARQSARPPPLPANPPAGTGVLR